MSELSPDVVKAPQYKPASVEHVAVKDERISSQTKNLEAIDRSEEPVTSEAVRQAGMELSELVKTVSGTDLSFSVEEELSRMVVTVRAVGSDEVIRQFPPEEFLTVAKFIAATDISEMDEEFLKGILFDRRG